MSRVLRLVWLLSCTLAAWLFTGTASARDFDAPRCDERGATTFEAPPVLQPLWHTLYVPPDEPCQHAFNEDDTVGQGHQTAPRAERLATDPMTPTAAALIVLGPELCDELAVSSTGLSQASAHGRLLLRPPR